MQVCEQANGYHEFSVCPKKSFDRWANSRNINFKLMVKNYTKKKGFGWTQEGVDKDFRDRVTDVIWLCKTIKPRMFNTGIHIDL